MKEINDPIIIIGAGRSGTNVLRDALTSFDEMITWPCDEINLIFRHGNRHMNHDEFDRSNYSPAISKFIHHQFEKLQGTNPKATIVEKTCANSLRVEFLNAIFPTAKFIFITRNGYDVTSSAMQRWSSSVELSYLLKKVRYVPLSDIPFYSIEFFKNRLKQYFNSEKKLPKWGPTYAGMLEDVKQLTLAEVCAKQWKRCVEKAATDLQRIDSNRVYHIRYEDFTYQPLEEMKAILNWLGSVQTEDSIQNAVKNVRRSSVGKGIKGIPEAERLLIAGIIEPTLKEYHDKS